MAAPAISTTASFNMTRDQICRRSLRLIGAIEAGETPGADLMSDVVMALQGMTKAWQASGLHLWTETEGTIFPFPGQNQYPLGLGASTLAVNAPYATGLTAAVTAGALVIPALPSATAAVGDTLLVQNALGGWSQGTVTAVNVGSLTIASPGLSAGASLGAAIYTWPQSALMLRPLRVLSLRRYNVLSGISVPLSQLARLDFRDLPNQGPPGGLVNSWFYDPQLTYGQLWLWLNPQVPIGDICNVTYMRPLMDWSAPGNYGDFPQEWLDAIAYSLACRIAPEYQVPASQYQMLKQTAEEMVDVCSGFDREPESVFFGVATWQGWSR